MIDAGIVFDGFKIKMLQLIEGKFRADLTLSHSVE
jgi:hypothetical protein